MSEQKDTKTKLYTPVYNLKPEAVFKPVDTMVETYTIAKESLGASVIAAALINTLAKKPTTIQHKVKSSALIVGLATVGASTVKFVSGVSANLREKNDGVNDFYGGFAGGAIVGIPSKKVSMVLGCGFFFGSIFGIATWAGNGLSGLGKDSTYNILDKTENVPKLFGEKPGVWDLAYRRPLSQTVELLGEDSIALKK